MRKWQKQLNQSKLFCSLTLIKPLRRFNMLCVCVCGRVCVYSSQQCVSMHLDSCLFLAATLLEAYRNTHTHGCCLWAGSVLLANHTLTLSSALWNTPIDQFWFKIYIFVSLCVNILGFVGGHCDEERWPEVLSYSPFSVGNKQHQSTARNEETKVGWWKEDCPLTSVA